jgi:hypothetical protein
MRYPVLKASRHSRLERGFAANNLAARRKRRVADLRWSSVIFVVVFASLSRTGLIALDLEGNLAVSSVVYVISTAAGLGAACWMDTLDPRIPKMASAVLGSLAFVTSGFVSGAGGMAIGVTIAVYSRIVLVPWIIRRRFRPA